VIVKTNKPFHDKIEKIAFRKKFDRNEIIAFEEVCSEMLSNNGQGFVTV